MNINNIVYVKLTPAGKKISEQNIESKYSQDIGDGWSKWSIWNLMYVFGEYCAHDKGYLPQCFEDNKIMIRRPKIKEVI